MSAISPATNGTTITSLVNDDTPAVKKPVRKKKEPNPEEIAAKVKEPKKPVVKKPKAIKDPNAPPVQRKRKAAGDSIVVSSPALAPTTNISTSNNQDVTNGQHITSTQSASSFPKQHKITDLISPTYPIQQSTLVTSIIKDPPTPTQRPASSGRMFDPIRGATVEKPPVSPTPQPSSNLNRASASPAIKSLMNPTPTAEPIRMAPISPAIAMSRQPSGNSVASLLSNAPQTILTITNKASVPTKSRHSEVDIPTKSKKVDAVSAPPSNAPTPPQKPKISREVPPLPTGSGLLSGTPFGLTAAAPNGTSTLPAGTNIWLKFDLRGKENVTINFAHEVEKKYGAAALNPRLAARKERQRQLALAGAALERELGESAEDMSIDMSEPESNNDTDGPTKDGTDGEPAKKKRKRRTEDYDRNDDFIDDEEVLLEEQALMTKDGFFVYSGPLIQEGERPAVERADGSIRRGRGRGRGGRGGASVGESGRASASSGGAKRSGGPAKAGASANGAGAAGAGAGAGNGVRKPRVTKAEKAAMDAEKLTREKTAASLAVRPAAVAIAAAPAVATASVAS